MRSLLPPPGGDLADSSSRFYGGRWKVERVFADLGKTVSGATSAAPYKNKVLLTGVWTKDVRICELP